MQHPDCRFVKAIGSTTIQQDSDGSDERWTIEACAGKTFAYSVVVFPEVGGGITDMVGNVDSNTPDDDNRASPALSQEECGNAKTIRYIGCEQRSE